MAIFSRIFSHFFLTFDRVYWQMFLQNNNYWQCSKPLSKWSLVFLVLRRYYNDPDIIVAFKKHQCSLDFFQRFFLNKNRFRCNGDSDRYMRICKNKLKWIPKETQQCSKISKSLVFSANKFLVNWIFYYYCHHFQS